MEKDGSDEELFALDETCIPDTETSPADTKNDDRSSYYNLLMQNLKSRLAGVPPPPQLTHPQQKIEDVLELLRNDVWINYQSNKTGFFRQIINCDQSVGETRPWPDVKECVFFDICYNVDKSTENLVNLCDVYRERYVGCETSSFVTANSPSKYSGKKKERRKLIGRSPRRQTHLTQRRRIFSSASLKEASTNNALGLGKRTILMARDNKKTSRAETKRALFVSADEQKIQKLEVPKQSLHEAEALGVQGNLAKESTPPKLTPQKCGAPGQRTPRKQTTPRKSQTPGKTEEYRSFNENGKRRLSDADNCCASKSVANKSSELTHSHRRKLLWAVSTALGKMGIKPGHTKFRSYGKNLFRVCRKLWTSSSTETTMNTSTSEQMLTMASVQLPAVMKEMEETKGSENPDLFSHDSNSWDCFANNA